MLTPICTHYAIGTNDSKCCIFAGARAQTPEDDDNSILSSGPDAPESLQSPAASPPPPPSPTGRRKADAAVPAVHPTLVLSRISGRVSQAMTSFVNDVPSRFQVPDGELAAGVESEEFRAGMKRRAEKITRSECEIFSFSKKYNLPRAAMDELIASVGNVSTHTPPVNSTYGYDVM